MLMPKMALLLALGFGMGTAEAAPTISIDAPPPGALYDPNPTISVSYGGGPLDLSSLRVTVNGADWTARFSVGPSSATYSVTGNDELIGGDLVIAAQIDDTGTPPQRAVTEQQYQVFPTIEALMPPGQSPITLIAIVPACSSSLRRVRSARTWPHPSGRWTGCGASARRSAGESGSKTNRPGR